MKQLRILLTAILLVGVTVAIGLSTLPTPADIKDALTFRSQLILVSLFSINYFSAAILFLYGMRDFKPEMRRPYRIITGSIAYFGLANLQYPILLYAGYIPEPWVTHGGSLLTVIPGVIWFYYGIRQLGTTFSVQSKFMSWTWMVASIIGLTALAMVIPHRQEMTEFWYGVHTFGDVVNLVVNLFAAGVMLRVVQVSGRSYLPSFRWLAAGAGLSAVGFIHIYIVDFFGQTTPYGQSGVTALPFVIVAAFYIVTGYQFCKLRFYGLHPASSGNNNRALIDAVIIVANLVSDRRDVEAELERLRAITANLGVGKQLSPQDNQTLIDIYLRLEDYLLHRERLRTFNRDGLRARLSDEVVRALPRLPRL